MVLGLLTIASIPTIIGVAEGVAEQRKANNRQDDEERMAKFYMDVLCKDDNSSTDAGIVNGKRVVLNNNKVFFSLLIHASYRQLKLILTMIKRTLPHHSRYIWTCPINLPEKCPATPHGHFT